MDVSGLLVLSMFVLDFCWLANGYMVFPVHHKFRGPPRNLTAIIAHDDRRQDRFPLAVDLNLGGNGKLTGAALYYTKLGLGSPSKDYYVQVDTGSDIFWVNCIGCPNCPRKSDLGIELMLYDPKGSKTSSLVSCDEDFCTSRFETRHPNCKHGLPCAYNVTYEDTSSTSGYYVKDYLTFNQVIGNFHTTTANSSVIFGCETLQSGVFDSSDAVDGILGFGKGNSSALSQLAATGKVKKVFSHCLDNIRGGGIFAIGEVVEPKVNTTPLVRDTEIYIVVLKNIEVDHEMLDLPTNIFDTGRWGEAIIDSGTTMAYLPDIIYDQLMTKVMARQSELKLYHFKNQFTCFVYRSSVDDGFPVVKFHFEGSLSLVLYPHDYLFQISDNNWCVGWLRTLNSNNEIVLGDLVLSNKLVVYDIENMTIGWTEFNCSSNIKVKDEATGATYTVGAHNLSSASTVLFGRVFTFFLLLATTLNGSIG